MNPLRSWHEKQRANRDLADEMNAHLAERMDTLIEAGHPRQNAEALARQQFGNVMRLQEHSVEQWGWTRATQLLQDLRYGGRVLRGAPGYTSTAVLVLALGIGMNTAMFSVIKAVLLSALPYGDPDRIVALWQTSKSSQHIPVSGPDFKDWRAQSHTLAPVATFDSGEATLSGNFETRRIRMAPVGSGFFEIFNAGALFGRTFGPAEQKPGGAPTLVLSYELARTLAGEPAKALGLPIRMNGLAFTVIGVMPPRFDFPERTECWLPNDSFPDDSARSAHNFRVLGRLRPNATLREAQADMNVVAARLANQYADDKDMGIRLVPLYDELVGSVRPSLMLLFGAVSVVLLIACVNTSGLQLARASARKTELALRSALGAGPGRLIRQLLTESVLLSLVGGGAGLVVALLAVEVLRRFAPASIPRLETLSLDPAILCFTAGLSIFAGLLFGILPALQISKADPNDAIKEGSGRGVPRTRVNWGHMLVAGQIALAIILLSGSALLLKSYWKLSTQSTGLDAQGVHITDITWPVSADGNSVDGESVTRTGQAMLQQIGMLPGVSAAALVNGLPFEGAPNGSFEIEGQALPADPHQYPDALYHLATAGYFKVFGLPLLRGRGFTPADERSTEQVAIVNQAFTQRFFPATDPVGARIRFLGFDRKPRWMTIVGVVPDTRSEGLKRAVAPEVFAHYFQHAGTRIDAALVVRGQQTLQPEIKRIVTALNHDTATNFQTMDALILGTVARERFEAGLLALFAACALLLAVVGIYGLLSYVVSGRRSEFGVRMALGAEASAIRRLVLGQGGWLVLVGALVGLSGALLATRLLRSMLFNVSTLDPLALAAAVLAFGIAGMAACYFPARRASSVDPASALRRET